MHKNSRTGNEPTRTGLGSQIRQHCRPLALTPCGLVSVLGAGVKGRILTQKNKPNQNNVGSMKWFLMLWEISAHCPAPQHIKQTNRGGYDSSTKAVWFLARPASCYPGTVPFRLLIDDDTWLFVCESPWNSSRSSELSNAPSSGRPHHEVIFTGRTKQTHPTHDMTRWCEPVRLPPRAVFLVGSLPNPDRRHNETN